MLQDAHVHLHHAKEASVAAAIIKDAQKNGVGRFFCNAASPEDWHTLQALSKENPSIIPFYGIHPWGADKAEKDWKVALGKYLAKRTCGVGEIGLDHRKDVDINLQNEIFFAQLEIALERDLPVSIHCVHAWGAVLEKLRSMPFKKMRIMFHLFSGSQEVLSELISMGVYFSFSFGIADCGPEKVRKAFLTAPLDKIFLETDYPYVQGPFKEPEIGSSGYFDRLKELYKIAALVKNIDKEEMEKVVWDNGTVFLH